MSITRLKAKMSKRKIEEMSYSPKNDEIIQQPPIVKGKQTKKPTQTSVRYKGGGGDINEFLQSKLFSAMFSPTNPGWVKFVTAFSGLFVEEILLRILYFSFAPVFMIHSDRNIYDIFITFNGFILPEPTPDSETDSSSRVPPLCKISAINPDALFSTIGEIGQFRIDSYEIRQSDALYFLKRKGFDCLIYVLKHTCVNIDGDVQDLVEVCERIYCNGNWKSANMLFELNVNQDW